LNRLDPATGKVEQLLAVPNDPNGLSDPVVSALTMDQRGRLWVGTHGGGVDVIDERDGKLAVAARIGTAQGLPVPIVAALSTENGGKIWASTTNGVAQIDTTTLRARPFGRAEGLTFQSYFVGAMLATDEGDLLMGSSGGYTIVHKERTADWTFRPAVVISAIRLDGRTLPGAQQLAAGARGLTVPPGVKSIEVEAASLDFSAARKNRYGFWLEGYDKDWVDGDASRRVISYGNLAPGHYQLRIRGSNRDGVWSSNELLLQMTVLPAWHQSWWAYLAYALAALALAWSVYHWRLRQLQRNQARLQALVYSRTQHLEKLHAIVKSVNEQLDFDVLLQTILDESTVIKGIHAANAWVRVIGTDSLDVRAAWDIKGNVGERGSITLEEAAQRFVQPAKALSDNMFLTAQPAGAVLAVRIRIDGEVQGYLVYENRSHQFDADDLDLLKALQEPFISAFQKAHAMYQLERARANAVAATRAKSDFLANISHEIRTPMNAILGFAGLGTHLDLAPQPLDYFRKIGRAGQNLLGIINDVLDFSKIESGKLELEAVPFDLHDTLNQIADMFAWRAAEKGLELVVWAAPDVPANLVGDPLRLSQVLINLVGNALKFTSTGFVQLQVEVDGAATGEQTRLRFTVEDSGVGLSKDQLHRLFQAFVQADASTTRVYGGTGLGLAISQQLVAKMGGVISVDSQLSQGSRFSFAVTLPVQAAHVPRHWEAPLAARGKAILVVDDSPPTREVLLLQLRSFGFDASAVGSGAAALLALELRPHDLVLMDWNMPDMDGIETTRQIKNHPGLPMTPTVIMVTAFDREHIKMAAGHAGVDAFLVKPVNPSQLLQAVLSALGFAGELPPAPELSTPDSTALQIEGARVLVVDDNAINQQVAGDILLRAGVLTDFADSGVDAVRMVDQVSYDAVFMDIQMPDMDGYQATAIIREKTQHAYLPIIAMTAHAVAGYREHCMAMGMNDYVSKPIEPAVLYEVLAKWARPVAPSVPAASLPATKGGTAPASIAGIDLPDALARLGGNEKLLTHLLTLFVEDFAHSPRHIQTEIGTGQLENATLMVHKIRGAAGNLSAKALYTSAGELEEHLTAGRTERLDELLTAFAADFDTLLDSARAHGLESAAVDLQN
jgi:signal transduction histidine kinase/DNA-binding response OmpR family regulator/HPt (histidine-containing phosphotransfer) domain-containing protein